MQPKLRLLLLACLLGVAFPAKWANGQTGSQTFTSSGTFTAPPGVTSVTIEAWGGGGGGGGVATVGYYIGAGGGGGGGYSRMTFVPVTPGNSYLITVGTGGRGGNISTATARDGGNTSAVFGGITVSASGGKAGGFGNEFGAGIGGEGGSGILSNGGRGASGNIAAGGYAGGGGSSAGVESNGNNANGAIGGVAVMGGGAGGNGQAVHGNGSDGLVPGGGGGGGRRLSVQGTNIAGGSGANGKVIISWSLCAAPTINSGGQPVSQMITYGSDASFTVSASGQGTLAYQWEVSTPSNPAWTVLNDNNLYSGTTAATLNLAHPPVALSGNRYRVVVSGCTPTQSIASEGNALLTVNKAQLMVSAIDESKTYNGTVHQGGAGVNYQGFVNGETPEVLAGTLSFSGSSQGAKDAGRYIITPGGQTAQNYDIQFMDGILTIYPRAVTVQAEPKEKIYGDKDPELTYEVSEGELAGDDVLSGVLSRARGENVGGYAIEQNTLTAGNNYELKFVGASLVIEPRAITITADARNKVYGETDPDLTYIITSGSLAFEDVFSGALGRQAGEDVGNYAIEQASIALSGNYTLSYIASNLSIAPRAITVVADGQRKIYGEDDPVLSYQITAGELVGSDNFTGALSRDHGERVGTYAILPGTLALGNNYNLAFIGANLSIDAKAASVTLVTNAKEYGAGDPVFTGTLDGFLAADNVTATYRREPGESVAGGPYTIHVELSPADVLLNYRITYYNTDFIIKPKKVRVAADANGKLVSTPDPVLTYKITSGGEFVGADDIAGSLKRIEGEDLGKYAIDRGSLSLSSNFVLDFVGAEFTIYAVPKVVLSTPDPVQINTSLKVTANLGPDVYNANWIYSIASPGTATASETDIAINSPAPVVYAVHMAFEDGVGGKYKTSTVYAVFYDPYAGFVTGGGWINSPAGAYRDDVTLTGKANFGFVSKYEKGKTVPSGNTEFQFQAGGINFKSSVYEWLIISGESARAQYKGSGTINGTGDYGFLLTAIDGNLLAAPTADKFRIKIWNKSTGATVYDNQYGADENAGPTTEIGGGSIVVHTATTTKGKTTTTAAEARVAEVIEPKEFSLKAFPNPSVSHFNVQVSSDKVAEKIKVRVLDLYGRTVEVIQGAYSGQTITIGGAYRPGVYFVEMIQGSQRKQIKLLKQAD